MRSKAQKVLQKSEQQGRNDYSIEYDERNPFSLDCERMKPIYKGSPQIKCSYCSANYSPVYKGRVCAICEISAVSVFLHFVTLALLLPMMTMRGVQVGVDTVGLVTQSAVSRTK